MRSCMHLHQSVSKIVRQAARRCDVRNAACTSCNTRGLYCKGRFTRPAAMSAMPMLYQSHPCCGTANCPSVSLTYHSATLTPQANRRVTTLPSGRRTPSQQVHVGATSSAILRGLDQSAVDLRAVRQLKWVSRLLRSPEPHRHAGLRRSGVQQHAGPAGGMLRHAAAAGGAAVPVSAP